jgi:integrase
MARIRKRIWTTGKGEKRTAWAVDYTDAQGKRQRTQFDSRAEADDFRIATEGKLRTGEFRAEASKVTLREAAELFLGYCKGRLERGERMTRHNYEVYEGQVFNYICPDAERHAKNRKYRKGVLFAHGIGHLKLAQLTARAVNDFRDELRNAGLSVTTTRKVLMTMKLILNYAISRDLLAINVAQKVRVIGKRGEGAKKIIPPTKQAMRQLIGVAGGDMRVKLIFAAATGVRAGEFHALRWKHLDLVSGEALIETRVDAYGEEDVTKTEAGMRTIPLGAELVAELKAWRARTARPKDDDLVFPNKRGWYENHDNMVKRRFLPLFARLAELHGADSGRHAPPPKVFNWHALRHFAVSTWIDAGLAPKTIQTFAGHSTLAVTMDIYGHLFKSDQHKTAMDEIARGLLADAPVRAALQKTPIKIQEFNP